MPKFKKSKATLYRSLRQDPLNHSLNAASTSKFISNSVLPTVISDQGNAHTLTQSVHLENPAQSPCSNDGGPHPVVPLSMSDPCLALSICNESTVVATLNMPPEVPFNLLSDDTDIESDNDLIGVAIFN